MNLDSKITTRGVIYVVSFSDIMTLSLLPTKYYKLQIARLWVEIDESMLYFSGQLISDKAIQHSYLP